MSRGLIATARRHRPMSRAFAVAVLALGICSVPVPAQAEKWTGDDPSGDVAGSHYDWDPEPCGTITEIDGSARTNEDITGLTAQYAGGRLRFAVQFRDLLATSEQMVDLYVSTPGKTWELEVDRFATRSGKFKVMTFLTKAFPPPPEDTDECLFGYVSTGTPCRISRAIDFDADTIRLALPATCLRTPTSIRVGVRASGDGPYDPKAGFDWYDDEWGVHAEGESVWYPPFGPEIHPPVADQSASPSNRSLKASSSTGTRRSLVRTLTGFPIGTTAATAYRSGIPSSSFTAGS